MKLKPCQNKCENYMCSGCKNMLPDFEAHAVEVLAKTLCNKDGPTTGLFWNDSSESGNIRQHYRAEALALLGLEG